MTSEQIAEVCHEANRGYQCAVPVDGVPVALSWHPFRVKYPEQAAGVIEGVELALSGATSEEMHHQWMRSKINDGWKHGIAKDADAKTHPCLVPYCELPLEHRLKDRLFLSIVHTLAFPQAHPCPLCDGVAHGDLPLEYSLFVGGREAESTLLLRLTAAELDELRGGGCVSRDGVTVTFS